MQLTTDKGKTYQVSWAWGPLFDGAFAAEIAGDVRPLSVIATEMEGVECFHTSDPNEGERDFTGFRHLVGIKMVTAGHVEVRCMREVDADD